MGSYRGAIKSAASKAGLSVEEYRARRAAGLKRCTDCGQWCDESKFARDRSRSDGLAARCGLCASRRSRAAYIPVPPHARRPMGPPRAPRRDGDALQARARINADVRMGARPNPNELHCARCGHRGPDRRHEYHHHMGYAGAHHNDVLVLCSTCHHEEHRDGDED